MAKKAKAAKKAVKKKTPPKAAKKASAKKTAAVKVRRGPRHQSLPGMEDSPVTAIENAALAYAEVRDARMALTTSEVEAKAKVLAVMKSHGKSSYKHAGISVKVTVEKEKVAVRVRDVEDEPASEPQADNEVEESSDEDVSDTAEE